MALDRDRLMRVYAPRLARQQADALGYPDARDEDETEDDVATPDTPSPDDVLHTGVVVALFLDPDSAAQLALPDGEPASELHLTLAYLGDADEDVTPDQVPALIQAVTDWANQTGPITITTRGLGQFDNADECVQFATIDSTALVARREALVAILDAAGIQTRSQYSYTPHITLRYGDSIDVAPIPQLTIRFDHVDVAVAGQHTQIPLRAAETARAHTTPRTPPAAAAITTTGTPAWNPIVTTLRSRTFLTAPATTERAAMWGAVPNPNPHMLWMQGRFVGAEVPNRNNALWSVKDLEMGHPTVAYGPLNWLHEDKHVIGTIADAQMVASRTGNDAAAADTTSPPVATDVPQAHITALAAIWRWLYPDEAAVVEMASDSGQLAYSMECISESVECTGASGCGEQFPYIDVSAGRTCDHLKDRSSTRRLINPTFLGGAVIVPPTRPGWTEANAQVLRQAAAMAEKAYDQAGRPDIPANEWEQMMAGILKFASKAY